MKKITLFLAAAFLLGACTNQKNESGSTADNETQTEETIQNTEERNADAFTSFNPDNIPETNAELGQFPYYTVPDWLKTGGYSGEKELDFALFEFYTGTGFYPVEGPLSIKYFSVKGENEYESGTWNEYKFVQSFRKHFESLGAKKIWEGGIPWDAFDQLDTEKNNTDYSFKHSHKGSQDNQVVYALKQAGKEVFFLIASNSSYGSVIVAQNGEFEQTIGILKSDEIKKQLDEKGKAVLYINFDTDKATLKAEGKEAVAEITKTMNSDNTLEISIDGYTDNTGSAEHNLKLSQARAETVKKELVQS
ncbi:MAG: OmpA family protein, partial [Bacteroidia bacterium]|nr:OmpA family protein [Bacteroidia bacterium]